MRTAFIETLLEVAKQDERIWLVTGDLGYSVLEKFAHELPQQFVNVGVAEQNMIGVAAGLALAGKIVFTYSIANFPIIRCLEQIRNDVCYHGLSVKIVAVGGGFSYGAQGYTHHGIEDLAMMRVLPNMTVVAPADPVETRLATQAIVAHSGPCYLRLGRSDEPVVHQTSPEFVIGQAIKLQDGNDLTFFCTGGTLELVLAAAQHLAVSGCAAGVVSMPTIQPLDQIAILQAAKETGRIITVEEHGIGGLSSAVSEVLLLSGYHARMRAVRIGHPTRHTIAGSQEYLRSLHGLSVDGICAVAYELL